MSRFATAVARTRYMVFHGAYVPTEYFVFDKQKLVYLSIPKVACTSVKFALSELVSAPSPISGDQGGIHASLVDQRRLAINKSEKAYFKFALVRNPFSRLVSCFEDKVKSPRQHIGRYYFESGYNDVVSTLFRRGFSVDMTFPEFVDLVSRVPDPLSDAHFRSQSSMLFRHGRCRVDYIGRIEDLPDSWHEIADRYGLPGLSFQNSTGNGDWQRYYEDRTVLESVAARFSRDVSGLGYESEYTRLVDRIV